MLGCLELCSPNFKFAGRLGRVMGYADAQEGTISRTAFRSAEKKYKRYTHISSANSRHQRSRRKIAADGKCDVAGVSRVEGYDWPVYKIDKKPAAGKGWEFHDNPIVASKWSLKPVSAESLVQKLRWATIGVQFEWSKRAYNEALPFQEIPRKLAGLVARLAKPAVEAEDFKAEAAIVNFYGPDDMLGGHVDDMEADMSKPIVSVSLGCKAVFLLGVSTRDEPTLAMFVRSGDVVLIADPAQYCFHGVPHIFGDEKEAELPDFTSVTGIDGVYLSPILKYLESTRININIRQVH